MKFWVVKLFNVKTRYPQSFPQIRIFLVLSSFFFHRQCGLKIYNPWLLHEIFYTTCCRQLPRSCHVFFMTWTYITDGLVRQHLHNAMTERGKYQLFDSPCSGLESVIYTLWITEMNIYEVCDLLFLCTTCYVSQNVYLSMLWISCGLI